MGDKERVYNSSIPEFASNPEESTDIFETSHCEVACISKDLNSVYIFNIKDNQ